MSSPHLPSRSAIATRPRLLRLGAWDALTVSALAVFVSSLGLRGHFHARVRLGESRWLSAPSSMALLAAFAIVVALVGRRREVVGLLGLAGVALGLAAFWLLLGHHRWAGLVIIDFGDDHGVHIGDLAAFVPMAAAGGLTWIAALRSRTRPRSHPTGGPVSSGI